MSGWAALGGRLGDIPIAGGLGRGGVLPLMRVLGRRHEGGGDGVEAPEDCTRIHFGEVEHRDPATPGQADRPAGAANALAVSRPAGQRMSRWRLSVPSTAATFRACRSRTLAEQCSQAAWCGAASDRMATISAAPFP